MTLPTTCNKPSQEDPIERERRHINREDDPHFDPTDKTAGHKIPGADQTPNHEVKRTPGPRKSVMGRTRKTR